MQGHVVGIVDRHDGCEVEPEGNARSRPLDPHPPTPDRVPYALERARNDFFLVHTEDELDATHVRRDRAIQRPGDEVAVVIVPDGGVRVATRRLAIEDIGVPVEAIPDAVVGCRFSFRVAGRNVREEGTGDEGGVAADAAIRRT